MLFGDLRLTTYANWIIFMLGLMHSLLAGWLAGMEALVSLHFVTFVFLSCFGV